MKKLILIPAGVATDKDGNEVENFIEYTPLKDSAKADLMFWFVCTGKRQSVKKRRYGAMISLAQLKADFETRAAGPWHDQLNQIEKLANEGWTFDFDNGCKAPKDAKSTPTVSGASGQAKADPEVIKMLLDKPAALKQYLAGFVK